MKYRSILISLAALVVLVVAAFFVFPLERRYAHITSFEQCAAAGYPIMESYPEQCRVPDGRTFTRNISQEASTTPSSTVATSSSTVQAVSFGKAITLRIGDRITFNDGLIVSLKEINDSRCKPGVQCIWQGELSPVFLVNGSELRLGTVTAKSATKNGYSFQLVNATATSATIIVTSANAASGISGNIHVGPTCPVESVPPQPGCGDRPFADANVVFRSKASGAVIARTVSDKSGNFRQVIAPGTYVITIEVSGILPRCETKEVVVKNGVYASTDISCDSGIR